MAIMAPTKLLPIPQTVRSYTPTMPQSLPSFVWAQPLHPHGRETVLDEALRHEGLHRRVLILLCVRDTKSQLALAPLARSLADVSLPPPALRRRAPVEGRASSWDSLRDRRASSHRKR